MALIGRREFAALADTYAPGANMGHFDVSDPAMGNIFGDAWRAVKKDPLLLAPPLWLGEKSIQYGIKVAKPLVQGAAATVRADFQPAPPPVDPLTQALTLGSAGSSSSSSSSVLPIVIGAGVLGVVLVLVLGRKKKS